jgi:PhoPQ-activated pathogenicity-related protein
MAVKHTRFVFALVVVFAFLAGFAHASGLSDYVAKPDSSYSYKIESSSQEGPSTAYFVRMNSQTWKDILWTHWLIVVKPSVVKHPETALLYVTGGDNTNEPPKLDSDEARALTIIAQQTNSVTAAVLQVPNQPLFDGKTEDQIISYTFERFLKGEGEDWPLLFPMVKSAVRAMDTIQSIAKSEFKQDIAKFTVTGASKRGWTTWLTGASDPRVAAIAPMVIDVLNMGPQMRHQKDCYGAFSSQVDDYTNRGIQDLMLSDAGKRLLDAVDPYSYRDQISIPKTIILGTNDEYWTIDSAKLYFNDLKGEKYLHYEPNVGHGLNINVVPAIVAMYKETFSGEKLPTLDWKTSDNGTLEVTWESKDGKAALWRAEAPGRDFRQAKWSSAPLEGDGKASAQLTAPASGWAAYYVAVTFPLKLETTSLDENGKEIVMPLQYPYSLCTIPVVLPDSFPEHSTTETK